jgi:hypothetical protein
MAFLAAECVCCGARGPVSAGVDTDKARKKWNEQIKADAAHSAFYILEDADPEKLAEVCGLPYGVITAALKNIIPQNDQALAQPGRKKTL